MTATQLLFEGRNGGQQALLQPGPPQPRSRRGVLQRQAARPREPAGPEPGDGFRPEPRLPEPGAFPASLALVAGLFGRPVIGRGGGSPRHKQPGQVLLYRPGAQQRQLLAGQTAAQPGQVPEHRDFSAGRTGGQPLQVGLQASPVSLEAAYPA